MGITNDLFPQEFSFGVDPQQMRLCDPIPDPEDIADPATGRRGIDNFESFMRFLAPVGRGAVDDTVRNGETVFSAIGCAACHVPSSARDRVRIRRSTEGRCRYSRIFCCMTSVLATAFVRQRQNLERFERRRCGSFASGGPFSTTAAQPTSRRRFGRHRNEADLARLGFERLSSLDRAALFAFLRSL